MSQIIDGIDPATREEAIETTSDAVQRGELVVIPTDTVYGVGADAFDPDAVNDLLEAKGRGRAVPPPVLVPNKRTLDGLATSVPKYVRRLVDKFWPGPLTIVLKAQASLMWDLGDTNGTVALRMPDSDLALAVLAATGPMAVTSANRHGRPPATTAQEAHRELGLSVAVYLDGGPSELGQASTIIDCTGEDFVVLREGGLSEEELREVAFAEDVEPSPVSTPVEGEDAEWVGARNDPDSELIDDLHDERDSHAALHDTGNRRDARHTADRDSEQVPAGVTEEDVVATAPTRAAANESPSGATAVTEHAPDGEPGSPRS